jgi:hypothetical protein
MINPSWKERQIDKGSLYWGPDIFFGVFPAKQERKKVTSEVFRERMSHLPACLGIRERGKRGTTSAKLRVCASSSVFLGLTYRENTFFGKCVIWF